MNKTVAIVDSGVANIASVKFALERLGAKVELTRDSKKLQQASHVILPGVGTAAAAMRQLKNYNLVDAIRELTQPVLGICLGMQLLYDFSAEGEVECLQIIPGKIVPLQPQPALAIPHMGWNNLDITGSPELFNNIENNQYVYFIHSYAAPIATATTATTNYNQIFTAAVQYKNFFATQFHPERSGKTGEQILRNFLKL